MLNHIDFNHKEDRTNVGLVRASPTPVDRNYVRGIYDPTGNVW